MNLNISRFTGDNKTWTVIQRWLDTCLQTHDRCKEKASKSLTPTRLLQLEPGVDPQPSFRVVHASEVEPGTRYATLSHCCRLEEGDIQLTESTAAQLSNPQPLSDLPLTFRDAFAVVARST